MADDRLPKRAAELREQGRRNVRKVGEEEDWKKKTRDRGGWKRLSDEAVTKFGQHLTPDKGKRRRESFHLYIQPLLSLQFPSRL